MAESERDSHHGHWWFCDMFYYSPFLKLYCCEGRISDKYKKRLHREHVGIFLCGYLHLTSFL